MKTMPFLSTSFKNLSVLPLVLLLSYCDEGVGSISNSSFDVDADPVTDGSWATPSVLDTWDWQLEVDAVANDKGVQVMDIDLFDNSAAEITQLKTSAYVICYFSAGSYEDWRSDSADFPSASLGETLDGWEDERWLDIRLESVGDIMETRLDLAVTKGCDAVEPDNVDGFQNNTGFALTYNDQLAYNRFIANAAHDRGLAVGLKNNVDQVLDLVDYYDFAVNEECYFYDECELVSPFIDANKAVFHAEYDSKYDDTDEFNAMCADTGSAGLNFSTVLFDLDLNDTQYESCN